MTNLERKTLIRRIADTKRKIDNYKAPVGIPIADLDPYESRVLAMEQMSPTVSTWFPQNFSTSSISSGGSGNYSGFQI